ncbi:LuxR C-terminal-related transcriptional regulator [Streptacidiphilus sp. EB129]|uniref:LuxR C-terminal-related transcriptional regulator n=1 Tax=Streptacidiphilus sp. EB129 TaxID=3156262 RepID=UPI003510F8F6
MCTSAGISGGPGAGELCDEGLRRYAEAIETGFIGVSMAPECLIHFGLVSLADDGVLVPVPPTTAATLVLNPLRRAALDQLEVIAAAEKAFAAADRVHAVAERHRAPDVRLIQGGDTISSILQAAVDGCQDELLTIQPGGRRPPELLERALQKELIALRRGVKQRIIYQHTVRSHEPTLDYIRGISEGGAQVRTVDEVIDRLIICDSTVAYIPTGPQRGQEALEVRHPAIVRFLEGVFNNVWNRAHPFDMPTPGAAKPRIVATEIQKAIMRMLVQGHTQTKIARELGMSARTVTSLVGKISEELESASPTQLGYLIATHGLLDQEPGAV